MKKIFSFAAVLFAAMTINAQEFNIVVLNEVANYLDFQAEYVANSDLVNNKATSTAVLTLSNGSELVGYQKSNGEEADMQWNVKPDYNTNILTPEWDGVDSLKVGTMWRAASGGSIVLGEFETSADGNLYVYFQPNGTSNRGISVSMNGEEVASLVQEYSDKYAYVLPVAIKAGYYSKGEIVVTVITNTVNIFGIGIENLGVAETAVENVAGAAKAQKVVENGQIYIIKNGVKYNVLGAIAE